MIIMEEEQPLRQRVRQQMLDLFNTMNLKVSTKILSENQLAHKFQVSRSTIRSVLAELEREGKVIRRHGSGTYVNPLGIHMDTAIYSQFNLYDLILKNGYTPKIFLKQKAELLPNPWCDSLGQKPTDPVCEIHSAFTADGIPCIYSVDCVDARKFSVDDMTDFDTTEKTIFDYVRHHANLEVLWSIMRIRASDSNRFPPLRSFFNLAPDEIKSVVLLEITNFNGNNEPVILGNVYVDTDIISLHILHELLGLH